ncbi:hypothetical protein H633G_09028 [Metarhizium anisopliae BRIP 53284]|nr:hypothetical protein H633G_09028 [Metarhizium anisopliae BRIP 53284]
MESIEPFILLESYRLVVCRRCQFAVVSNEVYSHLRVRHQDIPVPKRRKIAKAIAICPNIIQDQAGLVDFPFPSPTISYIPHLAPPHRDGLKCRQCPYIARQLQKIQAHCRTHHGWVNKRTAGRPDLKRRRSPSDGPGMTEAQAGLPWRENVACQRFFPSRLASGWFEIGRLSLPTSGHKTYAPETLEPTISLSTAPSTERTSKSNVANRAVQEHIAAVLSRRDQYEKSQNEPRLYAKELGEDSLAARSPWLERTRWRETYKDVRRDILRAMTSTPASSAATKPSRDLHLGQGEHEGDDDIFMSCLDEQKLGCLMEAVDLVLNRCETTAHNTSRLIRCWLVTSRANSYQSNAFSVMTELATQHRYRVMWKKFIAFVIRAWLLPSRIRRLVKVAIPPEIKRQIELLWEHRVWEGIEIASRKWPKMTDDRYEANLRRICTSMNDAELAECELDVLGVGENDSDNDGGSDSGSDSASDWDPEDNGNYHTDDIDETLLCDVEPDKNMADKKCGAEHEKRFLDDSARTEFLELLFQLSVALSKQKYFDGNPGSTLLVYFSGIFGFSSDYQHFLLARQFCPSLSGIIYVQRLLFLEYALPLFSYNSLGLRQRPRVDQLEHFKKVCDRYIVAGSPSALAELFSLRSFGYKVGKTEAPAHMLHWSEDDDTVSCGTVFTVSMQQFRELPEFFISKSEQFCTDLMYGLEPNIVISELKDDMINSKPGYSFVSHPANGLENGYAQLLANACAQRQSLPALSGHGRWNWCAVRQYLRRATELVEMIFGAFLTSGGQAPRLQELANIECENSPSNGRGIYIWNGSVVYIIRHHKAKRTTNHEFNVVRFLPARLGMVVVKYLAYIRRVVRILRFEMEESTKTTHSARETRLLFNRDGKPWAAERMTAVLNAAARQLWQQGLTSRIYRQVAIGITEKHVREVYTPFNRYDDRSATCDSNAVFAWQSGHRLSERAATYGLDGAYPHQLQPSLLRAYEVVSTLWHEFIQQESKNSPFPKKEHSAAADDQLAQAKAIITLSPRAIALKSSHILSRQSRITLPTAPAATAEPARSIASNTNTDTLCVSNTARILPQYKVLVCLLCKAGVSPGASTETHYRGKHNLKGEELKAVIQLSAQWQLLDPRQAPVPGDGSNPIPELPVLPGYKCMKCRYMTVSRKIINTHCRKQHESTDEKWQEVYLQTFTGGKFSRYWIIPVEGGFKCRACPFITTSEKVANTHWISAAHTLEGGRYTRVDAQSWMAGKYARYWTVGSQGYEASADIDARDEAGNERSPNMLEQIVRRGAKRMREANEQWRRAGQAQRGADYDNEFVKDMRWVEFSEGKDRAVIFAATRWINAKAIDGLAEEALAEDVEQREELVMLCDSIKREVKRCSPRIHAVPKPILQRLHGIEDGKSNPIPFRMSSDPDTLSKYSIVCQRYLCFCWRAYRLGREEARTRLAMRFTDEQWGLLCDMGHVFQEKQRNSRADGNESTDGHDSDTEGTDGYDSDIEGYRQSSQRESRRRSDHAELDGIMFRFLIASFKTKVGGAMYTNALLCFFAATAIRQGGEGFQPAGVFTATVAAMLWMLRLFFLEDSFSDMPLNVEDIPVEKMEWFSEQHAQWLSVDRFTVAATMINWMAYGKGHRNKTMATPTVRWTDDYETLVHNGEHVRIHEFQRAAYRVKLKTDEVMGTLFGGQWSTIGPNMDLRSIRDDMSHLGAGQSFATHTANAWLRSGPELAIKAAQSMLFDARKNEWKRKGVSRWLSSLRQVKGLLMVAGHVWGGMPGRGPEVSTMRHCDGLQVMRNVFVRDGSVMIATDRDKTKSIRDMGRKVARFLPDDLGRMFVAYIAWLLPAEELLEQEVQMPETARSIKEFMWRHGPSGRWKTEKLSSLLAREIGAELGLRMGTARYRIVVIEMGRVVEGLVMEEVEKRIEGDGRDGIEMDELSGEVLHIGGSWNIVWDLQSTHGTKTARQHYAVHIGMPGHLHPMLVRKYHEISRLWHSFLEKGDPKKTWGRGWGRARGDEEDEEDDEGNKKRPDVEDIKAESLAALRQLEGSGATWLSAKQEECMHAIMRLEGARHLICVLRTGAGKSNLFMAPALMRGRGTTVVVVPFSTLIDDLVKRTKEKGVDVVQFRSNQVIAREALPYVPRLVIVSADVAVDKNELFMAYMGKLDRGGHLQRIFIDEAHTTITDSSYREQLTKLKGLHRFCRPIIMLTATLMMTMEREFREMLLLPAETTRIIRDRTTKKNARYEFVQVVGREEGAVEKAAVQFIRRTQTSMMSDEKCIVYCKSIDDCREIAEKIGCGCHHSSMSEAQRREAVARWLSGQGGAAMAATAGLGTGLNFRGIVVIVHSGIPYGLVSFIQQTGRGARGEGEVVHCVVLHDGVKPFEAKGISSVALKDQHAMWTVATAPGCVREQIAMIMDGVMGECCADVPDAVPCCRCEPSYAFPSNHGEAGAATVPGSDEEEDACGEILAGEMGTYALTRRIDAQDTRARGFRANASVFQEDYRQMATDESTVKRWLLEVESKCAACFTKKLLEKEADGQARSMEDEEQHEALGASCPARARGMEPYRQMRKQLRFAAQSCCFTCKLPLDWCKEAKSDKGTADECVYMDKVLPAVTVAASSTRERQWIRDKFDIDPTDGQAFRQWLAGKRVFMETRGTNMHMLWATVVRRTFGHRMRAAPLLDE